MLPCAVQIALLSKRQNDMLISGRTGKPPDYLSAAARMGAKTISDQTMTNANHGVIVNSGNTIGEQQKCTVYVTKRDLEGLASSEIENDSLQLQRRAPAHHGGGGGGHHPAPPHHVGGGGAPPPHHGGPLRKNCKCQCKRSLERRSVEMVPVGAEPAQAIVQPGCTLWQDPQTLKYSWSGQCSTSTLAGKPLPRVFAYVQ